MKGNSNEENRTAAESHAQRRKVRYDIRSVFLNGLFFPYTFIIVLHKRTMGWTCCTKIHIFPLLYIGIGMEIRGPGPPKTLYTSLTATSRLFPS